MPGLQPLYDLGLKAPRGEVIMIAGRSGSMKSMFALWWTYMLGLPTLYFSADMSPTTVGTRLAAMITGHPATKVARDLATDPGARSAYAERLAAVRVWFEYGSPIRWSAIDTALNAYVSIWDAYPKILVIDNLMDVEDSASEYSAQMEAMAAVTELARAIDATVLLLHHATDKTMLKSDPWLPPSRSDIKGGMSEKPAVSLSVAFVPEQNHLRVAIIKQREGRSDPTGQTWVTLHVEPETARFYPGPQMPGMTSSFNR